MRNAASKPDMELIRARIEAYFAENTRFSIPGLCLALDICKETLGEWEQGRTSGSRRKDAELSDTVKKALLRIERYLLESDTKTSTKDMAVLNSVYGYKQPRETPESGEEIELDLGKIKEWSR